MLEIILADRVEGVALRILIEYGRIFVEVYRITGLLVCLELSRHGECHCFVIVAETDIADAVPVKRHIVFQFVRARTVRYKAVACVVYGSERQGSDVGAAVCVFKLFVDCLEVDQTVFVGVARGDRERIAGIVVHVVFKRGDYFRAVYVLYHNKTPAAEHILFAAFHIAVRRYTGRLTVDVGRGAVRIRCYGDLRVSPHFHITVDYYGTLAFILIYVFGRVKDPVASVETPVRTQREIAFDRIVEVVRHGIWADLVAFAVIVYLVPAEERIRFRCMHGAVLLEVSARILFKIRVFPGFFT